MRATIVVLLMTQNIEHSALFSLQILCFCFKIFICFFLIYIFFFFRLILSILVGFYIFMWNVCDTQCRRRFVDFIQTQFCCFYSIFYPFLLNWNARIYSFKNNLKNIKFIYLNAHHYLTMTKKCFTATE